MGVFDYKELNMEKELLHNEQYHVEPRSLEEVDILVKTLKQKGYMVSKRLDDALKLERVPVGICIDNGMNPKNGGKCVFQSSVTCMACYVSWSNKSALRVEDILDNLDKLIDKPDIEFYNELLDKRTAIEKKK